MIPHYFSMDDDQARSFITRLGAGTLVTYDEGFHATHLPIVWDGDRILLHVARFNDQWKSDFPRPAIMTFVGADGYVSSRDYDLPEGGASASTWDYTLVTIHGTLHLHDDREWVGRAALELTAMHDADEAENMPESYVQRASRAIVGLEFVIDRFEGQAKLSQNRLPGERQRISNRLRESDCPRSHQLANDIDEAPSKATRVPYTGGLRRSLEH